MKKITQRRAKPADEPETETEVTENLGALKEAPPGAVPQETSMAIALTRAEVDQQIVTARAYPRSITQASERIISLATLDTETAIECVYELPRGGKILKGQSIRFAEICASQWGNQRNAARVIHVDRFEKFVEAEGVFHDLETGSVTVSRVRRRIFDRYGKLFDEDMQLVTGQAACAIARRNAIMAGIPKGVWRRAYDAALDVIKGDAKTLVERREGAMKAFAALGVSNERVFAALGVKGLKDIDLDGLAELTAMRSAVKRGEARLDQLFPEIKKEEPAPKDLRGKMEALGSSGPTGGTAPDRPAEGASPAPSAGDGKRMGDPTNPPPPRDNRFADYEGQAQERERNEDEFHYPDQEEAGDGAKDD